MIIHSLALQDWSGQLQKLAMARRKTIDKTASLTQACVIGAGLGGLALAIRLQAAGMPTALVEARSAAGGLIQSWQRGGFTFDSGPSVIADLAALRELWSLTGNDLVDDLRLLPVAPAWRCNWPDGTLLDLPVDPAQLARFAPEELAGAEEFAQWCEASRAAGWQRLAEQGQSSAASALEVLPALVRHQGWRSAAGMAAHMVKEPHLRQALALPVLLAGANPRSASALHLLGQIPPPPGHGWWPEGGMGQLVAALVGRFESLGGTLRLHDPVVRLGLVGNRVTEVECASGWRSSCTLIASNADVMHTYRDLLGESKRGNDMARKLSGKRFSPSAFTVHFALEGTWPGIPHRTALMGPRFEGLLDDVFTHGVLPQDLLILLSHPSVTDPSLAPPGKSVFSATVPVAHLGKLPLDWEVIGKTMEQRILAEVGRRLVPDIADRLVHRFHISPRDLALDFNAWLGSGWGLEAIPSQSGPLRPRHHDGKITNLYLVGANSHPGAGVAAVLAGAKATAGLILENRT